MRDSTRKKRDFVIETAMRLFIERGFENVSVDDIIAATNTSKGTFYHYFKSKDDIAAVIGDRQTAIVERWVRQSPASVQSLESHINRLFLDLAADVSGYPKLVRSLAALRMQNENLNRKYKEQTGRLYDALMRWLPEHDKVSLLISAYTGILSKWCTTEGADLEQMIRSEFALLWAGLRTSEPAGPLSVAPHPKEEPVMKIAVIGGGLAGLTAAAYLSEEPGAEGVLFERSPQLGGRAFTYEKAGFTLNYGAHAVYGIDRHKLTTLEKELGLSFSSKQVDKRRVMYEKHDKITPAPLDFVNLMKTEVLSTGQKVRFVGEITAIIANIHQLRNYPTLGDYLAESNAGEDLKELWEHLVCSNFFISPEDARKVPGVVISEYYNNLFRSSRPVNYVLGSWAVITNQLKRKIELSGRWEIALQEGIDAIRYEGGKFVLRSKNRELAFDRVIFAMPVQQVIKLLKGTAWEPFLAPYESNTATEVMVYDVGLSRVVARPFSYISDMNNKLFISDVSATDHTLVPEGGQLLQGIAYLHDEFVSDDDRKAYLEQRMQQMERLFDRHYPGWREAIAVKRVSKKAMVASVKNIASNKLLPVQLENVPFLFCGDGCAGKGELAERAFSSARRAAQLLLKEIARPVPV
jgi:protoporphyrinogen oxidase/AcrR family transcriptional regulator